MSLVATSVVSLLSPQAIEKYNAEKAASLIKEASPLWFPVDGPQLQAYKSNADELLYGGAAGGGKSDLLLGLAFNQHHRAVIFRRTYPELDDLIKRSEEIGDTEQYKRGLREWQLANGQNIRFRHLDRPGAERKYQGHAYDLIGFDELTHFELLQYLFLMSRARTTKQGQRVRVVSTSNPGSSGNDWVMERWSAWLDKNHPNPAEPGELRWYVRIDDEDTEVNGPAPFEHGGEVIIPRSRTFVPAKLADNPYLGDDYKAQLMAMPEPLRSQLLNGDWSAGMTVDAYQVISRDWIKAANERWREWEQAGGVYDSLGIFGVDVGRGGDFSVIAHRHGDIITRLDRSQSKDTMSVAGEVAMLLSVGYTAVIDVIGIGAGVCDRLSEQGHTIIEFSAGTRTGRTDATGRLRFVNKRAAAWWNMRELLDPATSQIALPPDKAVSDQLSAPRWKANSNGRIQIESKDQIKKRIGRSTDDADAIIQAFWQDAIPGPGLQPSQSRTLQNSRWGATPRTGSRWRR